MLRFKDVEVVYDGTIVTDLADRLLVLDSAGRSPAAPRRGAEPRVIDAHLGVVSGP